MRTVCLFDIDGTLLSTGGAGQLAMERALARVFGITEITGEILAAGRTDRAITSDLFLAHGVEVSPETWKQFLQEYFQELPRSLAELRGRILPGVLPLLEKLAECGDISLGLLTGNFQDGAAIKLRHYQIDHHFAYGGYGDDHHDRDDVARLAFAAAAQHLRRELRGDEVWVLGDTPADVRCGRAIGARVVAVATGIYSFEALQETGPDLLVRDFSDVEPVLQQILS